MTFVGNVYHKNKEYYCFIIALPGSTILRSNETGLYLFKIIF